MTVFQIVLLFLAAICCKFSAASLIVSVYDNYHNGTLDKKCASLAAQFGLAEDFLRITGVIVNAVPVNGCHPLKPPPYKRNDSLTWVALMARDNSSSSSCFFDVKVFNAQNAGFGAALVFNYEDSVSVMQPNSLGEKIFIPAAMVTRSCGLRMREKYAYNLQTGSRYTISFKESFSFDFSVYVISFISVVFACFVFFALLWGIRWFRDWRIRQRSRLSKSSLKTLKVKNFVKGTDPYECCAICLDDFEPGDKLRILPCNHAYHMKCIDPWLLKSRSVCPVCKRRVFPRRPGDASDDSDDNAGDGVTASGAAAAGASVAAAGAASLPAVNAEDEGERTPLLLASGGSSSAGSVRGFDNSALRFRESPRLSEVADATAAAAAAAVSDFERGGSLISRSSSVVSECVTSISVSVSSAMDSDDNATAAANVTTYGAASQTPAEDHVTVVCVHQAHGEAPDDTPDSHVGEDNAVVNV